MASEALTRAFDAADELQITVVDRRSGREISLPVWFVRADDRLLLIPVHGSDTDWYKNARHDPTVQVAAKGARLTARSRPIDDPDEVGDVVDRFRAKFGSDTFDEYYPRHDVAIEVPLTEIA
jgi:deazaflavin-dependent oxidoreductase (nitroreductase family)